MPTTNLLQGTLDLLILKALALTGTARAGDFAPHRADHQRHLSGEAGLAVSRAAPHGGSRVARSAWGDSENNRRAKFYRLTAAGRRQLQAETRQWETIALAIASALAGELTGPPCRS